MPSYFFACTDMGWGDATDSLAWGVGGRVGLDQVAWGGRPGLSLTRGSLGLLIYLTHTHTHIYIYIYT
jgi:hypothetical protein